MIINKASLDAIRKNFVSLYNAAFGKAQPQWNRVAMRVTSSTSSNKYGWLGATTRIREWLGERVIQNLKSHDFEIKNKTWEDTVAVNRDDIEDDNLGTYSPLVTQMGDDVANFPDELVFELLANSFDTPCYDGQYLIDTDHPVLDADGNEVSVSNDGGGSGAPWFLIDDTKALKPIILQVRREFEFTSLDDPKDDNVFNRNEFVYGTDGRMNVGVGLWQLIFGSKQDLTAENYEAAREAMQGFKGDNGRPLRIMPKLLVCGPSNEAQAKKILKAEKDDAGATNINANTAELMVVPWLT